MPGKQCPSVNTEILQKNPFLVILPKKTLFCLQSPWWPMATKTASICPKMTQNHSIVHPSNVFDVFQCINPRNKASECLGNNAQVWTLKSCKKNLFWWFYPKKTFFTPGSPFLTLHADLSSNCVEINENSYLKIKYVSKITFRLSVENTRHSGTK